MSKETKATLEVEKLDVVADRGNFSSEEIVACEKAGITVTLPKPMILNSKAAGRQCVSAERGLQSNRHGGRARVLVGCDWVALSLVQLVRGRNVVGRAVAAPKSFLPDS